MLPGAAGSGTKYASHCAMLLPNRVDVYIVNGQAMPVESELRPSLSATTLQEKFSRASNSKISTTWSRFLSRENSKQLSFVSDKSLVLETFVTSEDF